MIINSFDLHDDVTCHALYFVNLHVHCKIDDALIALDLRDIYKPFTKLLTKYKYKVL